MSNAEKRQIFRSTTIIGGATAGALLIGLVRNKALALMLGPAGIGLIGTLTALMSLGTAVIGMGVEASSVRQLSMAVSDPAKTRVALRALLAVITLMAFAAIVIFVLFRGGIALAALGSGDHAGWVGLLGIGVALTLLAVIPMAELQSQQRMGDLARARLWAAGMAAAATVSLVYFYRDRVLIAAVLAAPAATFICALWYRRWQSSPSLSRVTLGQLKAEWSIILVLGAAVMGTAILGSVGQIAVRSIILQEISLPAAGLFQASFAISTLNIGLILGAMAADYYPRLARAADRTEDLNVILNSQVHVALVLGAPALLFISTAAPLVLAILYTPEFTEAALLLRIQLAADALRLAGWALGYVLLTRRLSYAYFFTEAALTVILIPLTWLTIGKFGIAAAGIAYLVGYITSVTTAMIVCRRHGIGLIRANLLMVLALNLGLLALAGLSLVNPYLSTGVGAVALIVVSALALRSLSSLVSLPGPIRGLVDRCRRR